MPKTAADLLRETLDMDCESAFFDPRLRQAITRALSQIEESNPATSLPAQERKAKSQFYVLEVVGDLEPQLHGPYATEARRDMRARQLRERDPAQNNGLFRLAILGAHPVVGTFTNLELQP